jgi:hypothetical protein
MPTIRESLVVALLILPRHLRFAIACAVVVKVAGAVFFHHLFGFGSAGCIGHPCFLSPLPFGKHAIRIAPWSSSKAFSVYGDPPSTAGSIIFENSSRRPLLTGVWPGTWSHRSLPVIFPNRYWTDSKVQPKIPKQHW